MVNEGNIYEAIEAHLFPGVWKRLHGLRGMPDYLVWCNVKYLLDGFSDRQFFVEAKELNLPKRASGSINLNLRTAQIPFFKSWPGEKYVLVRWYESREYSWFSGKERFVTLGDTIRGPFKRVMPK